MGTSRRLEGSHQWDIPLENPFGAPPRCHLRYGWAVFPYVATISPSHNWLPSIGSSWSIGCWPSIARFPIDGYLNSRHSHVGRGLPPDPRDTERPDSPSESTHR
jgi:hypothetical protein